uniref:Trans-1,2-dihydrobenzene-1,2-diol dehydrogenase n=1 Tax=Phallusia mammillata TaxID=59560 RepID=A0A6F9D5Z5_9ASCI|nr:trans-1,2-dihydrobenzene-1,2-diol dehydrogenase-like [Phallusia mammillata]
MDGKALRWGICSAGKISFDFVVALQSLPENEHQVEAVAARRLESAQSFAKDHNIPKAYGSYEELSKDADIDVVYIGVINTLHYDAAKMMLEAGKNVLCEKPLCLNVAETKNLQDIAKSKKLFLMEAIWSRAFPIYKKLKETIDSGIIGEVRHVRASFTNYAGGKLAERCRKKEMAGGAILDIGVYTIQFAQLVFGEKPISQISSGYLLETGVDGETHIILEYSGNRRAILNASFFIKGPREAIVCGSKGYIRIVQPFWCPEKMVLHVDGQKEQEFYYKLPPSKRSDLHFTNASGMQYEAMEVRRCLTKGLTESPLITAEMTLQIAEIMQTAREQMGYTLPQDEKWSSSK